MVSSAFARENFGGAAQALGKTSEVRRQELRTIVGVLPDGFTFPRQNAGVDRRAVRNGVRRPHLV
jgi:hypothetical protein